MKMMVAIITLGVFTAQAQADEARLSASTTSASSTVISGNVAAETLWLAEGSEMRVSIFPSDFLQRTNLLTGFNPARSNPAALTPDPNSGLRCENRRTSTGVGAIAATDFEIAPVMVPEPTTLALLSAGALTLLAAKRRVR